MYTVTVTAYQTAAAFHYSPCPAERRDPQHEFLDLEWNQCPTGKSDTIGQLPFEIIEIGAIKLDEALAIQDSFREVIRPQVYRTLHFKTREIVSLRSIDLENGRVFPEVILEFFDWCGPDPYFCTWGPSDLMELQRNMAFHQIPNSFPFPFLYYDIQKISLKKK